jgi:predicted nucleic acid-binding protein
MLDKGIEFTTCIIDLIDDILSIAQIEIEKAISLLRKYLSIESRDTIHTALMLAYGINEIISTNRYLAIISEIKITDPLEIQNLI